MFAVPHRCLVPADKVTTCLQCTIGQNNQLLVRMAPRATGQDTPETEKSCGRSRKSSSTQTLHFLMDAARKGEMEELERQQMARTHRSSCQENRTCTRRGLSLVRARCGPDLLTSCVEKVSKLSVCPSQEWHPHPCTASPPRGQGVGVTSQS